MAEAVLLGVAKSVLGQLSSPALKELLLVWNFKEDLKRLGETIETITCFIYDAEQRQSKERLVRMWLSRLKSVLYEADDLFDTVSARALSKQATGGSTSRQEVTLFFSKSNPLAFVVKTGHDIKKIRESLDAIRDDMSQFQYQKVEEKPPHSVLDREEKHSFIDNKEVIGREREREDLVSLLLSESHGQQSLEVISVIGFGGLGKTTLAQLVYNDVRVQKGFDMCLWTCINYLSDLELVLVKILTSSLKSKPRDLGLDQMQSELRQSIQGKKYLLVLDDVWDENPSNWGRLETLLNCGKMGSKVLITTRKTRVAQCFDAIEPYYRLNTLTKESAWSLFVKMAFKDDEFDGDSELVSVGNQILQKCGYVPLAISTIGRMLRYRKKDKDEWCSFLDKEFAEVVSSSGDDGNLMQVLKVSYNDLPPALQNCFAYCSIFPKDHKFDKDELIRMWIAQGFVEPHAKKSLEELGDDYFFYMVDRCFFQEVEKGDFQHTCKMHDLLHDLAIQVAASESNCILDKDIGDTVEGSVLRHLSITCSRNISFKHSNVSCLPKSLRTLRFIEAQHLRIESLKLVLDRFTKIRTLVLRYLDCKTLPNSIGGLIHLRYLDLSDSFMLSSLPNSICKLYHLQTLILVRSWSLVNLPTDLMKLVSLRQILLEECQNLDSMPSGLASLSSLVTLDRFVVHPNHGGLRYLGRLDKLSGMLTLELPMNGWPDCVEDARKANMQSKCRLIGLSILPKQERNERKLTGEKCSAILEELQPHENLQHLSLSDFGDRLPRWFSSLSNLKKLFLGSCNVEFLDVSVRSGYLLPHLEVLELYWMKKLRGWWRGSSSTRDNVPLSTIHTLPCVSKLDITSCESLVEVMPFFEVVEEVKLMWVTARLLNMLLTNPNAQCHEYKGSKLQVLYILQIQGLECLSEGSIKHLTALKRLTIYDCKELSLVSRRGLACLTSLEELDISGCGGVRLEDEDDNNNTYGLQRLLRLQRVTLSFEFKAFSFPVWTLQLPRLQNLILEECGEMSIEEWVAQQTQPNSLVSLTIHSYQDLSWVHDIPWKLLQSLRTLAIEWRVSTIPEGIQELTSLRRLEIQTCYDLKEIPIWINNLTSLQRLSLERCSPELEARCKQDTGVDWHLISHIPSIQIKEGGVLPWMLPKRRYEKRSEDFRED